MKDVIWIIILGAVLFAVAEFRDKGEIGISDEERVVLEVLWAWEQFADGARRPDGLAYEAIVDRVGNASAHKSIRSLERKGRIYRWSDGLYRLWGER